MAQPQANQQAAQQPNPPPIHPLFPRVAGNLQIDAVTNASMAFGTLPVAANGGTLQARELYQRHVVRNIDFRNPTSNQAGIHRDRLRNWTPGPNNGKQYLEAAMAQSMASIPLDGNGSLTECTRCSNTDGRPQGPFATCRVLVGNIPNVAGNPRAWLNGACANCHYHRKGGQCSLRPRGNGDSGPKPGKPNAPEGRDDDEDDSSEGPDVGTTSKAQGIRGNTTGLASGTSISAR